MSSACESFRAHLTYFPYQNGQIFRDMINSASIFKPSEKILGALAKLRKTTISFVPFVRMEQLGSHWAEFYEN
jgi:hypothetical protein